MNQVVEGRGNYHPFSVNLYGVAVKWLYYNKEDEI